MTTSNSDLHLDTGHFNHSVRLHPVVLMSIVDHYRHRKGGSRVIGSLLGTNADGLIQATSAFAVPHVDGPDSAATSMDTDYQSLVRDLHRRVSSHETLVGWYSVGEPAQSEALSSATAALHEVYWREMGAPPVYVSVEVSAETGISARAFVSSSLKYNNVTLGTYFYPVECEKEASELEKVAVSVLAEAALAREGETLEDTNRRVSAPKDKFGKVAESIEGALEYVRGVVRAGGVGGDVEVGRRLMEIAQTLPLKDPAELQASFSDGLQDVLMVAYLAKYAKVQLAISDRLRRALVSLPAPQQ